MGGNIVEPGAVGAIDMTGMSIQDCCQTVLTFPLAVIYQIFNLLAALFFAVRRLWVVAMRFYEDKKSQRAAEREAKEALKAKKGKGLYRRIKKTLNRYRNMIPGYETPTTSLYSRAGYR